MQDPEADAKRSGWLAIGVGNEWRGDDSIGLHVIRDLEGRRVEGLRTARSCGDAAGLIELWKAWSRVYVVDAMRSGSPPGTILRVLASDAEAASHATYRSSHLLGVQDAIRLSRVLEHLPATLVVYGIEGGSFELGAPISPEVSRAGEEVARRILEDISAGDRPRFTGPSPPTPFSPS